MLAMDAIPQFKISTKWSSISENKLLILENIQLSNSPGEEEKRKEKEDKKIIDRLWEIELILLGIVVVSAGTLISIVVGG